MACRAYPAEFRRKVLDLLAAGRKVADVARDLDVSDQTIYNWRRQDLIDRGLLQGLTTDGNVELAAAKKRVAALEAELRATKRAMGLVRGVVALKPGTRPSSRWPLRDMWCRCVAGSWMSPSPDTMTG